MTTPVIDLHMHTTASDGTLDPPALVDAAWRAGIRTMSVTDHDTVAGLRESAAAARASGITFVPGIEITAMHDGRDVHMLGYFFDPSDAVLGSFLEQQRSERIKRAYAIADRLAELGKPIEIGNLLSAKTGGKSIGRPIVAKALIAAGHVATISQAFEELLGEGRPAFMPRGGPTPVEAVGIIDRAGGVSSLAHPGVLKRDELIAALVDAGLSAIEAFHSEHDAAATSHYLALAGHYGVAVSGGSDYHGDHDHRRKAFGSVSLPAGHFEELKARVARSV